MSTKYQRPTGIYDGNAALANRAKYQSDAAAEPKVPISSTKMDGDFNYLIDALNSIDTASGSRASIHDRLSVTLNDDGTLKGSVVAGVDEWVVFAPSNLNRVNNSTLTCDGDQSGVFTNGRRVRLSVNGRTIYGQVDAATFDGSITTLVLSNLTNAEGVDDVMDALPAALYYSFMQPGYGGNTPTQQHTATLADTSPILRLLDKAPSGKEYAIRNTAGAFEVVENTGTTTAPMWISRLTVNSSGVALATGSLALDTLANGTPDRLIGFDGAGAPAALSTDSTLTLSGGVLGVQSGTGAGDLVALDGSARLPAVDGSQLTHLPSAGKVAQVVQGTSTATHTFASTSYATLVSQSITIGAGSKVKVSVSYPMRMGGGSALAVGSARLVRGGTTLFTLVRACGMSVDQEGCMVNYTYLDSPGSAGTYTYQAQAARYSGTYNLFSEDLQIITLEEILP